MAAEGVDSNIEGAKLAERAERYEDMAQYMKTFVEDHKGELSPDERNLLSVAYKNVVGSKRSSYRVLANLHSKQTEENAKKILHDYMLTVNTEIETVCNEVLELLKTHLVPFADNEAKGGEGEKKMECLVFYKKMAGDYHRYMAEVSDGEKKGGVIKKAAESYKEATTEAEKLPSTHPVRLGLALNYSVFYYEIMETPDKACELAKKAFDGAIAELDKLQEDSYKDSTLIMQLLRDNLTLWTSESADPEPEGEGEGKSGEDPMEEEGEQGAAGKEAKEATAEGGN